MIYTISSKILDSIEAEFEYKFKPQEVLFIALVNSFTRKGIPCKITGARLAHECRCSTSQVSKMKSRLKSKGIITIWSPEKQRSTKQADIIHFTKKTKDLIKSLFPTETVQPFNARQTVSCGRAYNNNIGDSESSFSEDSSSQPEEDLNSYLQKLNI